MKILSLLLLLVGCTDNEKGNDTEGAVPDTGPFDSDGDGYLDGEEVESGCDPEVDEGNYTGGWPTNPEFIQDPGWGDDGEVGWPQPRFCGSDQHGDLVDLYDFGGQNKPVVLDISTQWCGPCQNISLWIEDGEETHLQYRSDPDTGEPIFYPWYYEEMDVIPDLVQSGEVLWVTILVQNQDHEAPTQETVDQWVAAYPNDLVPVLLDDDQRIYNWMRITGYPTLNVVDDQMVFETCTNRGGEDAFAWLIAFAATL
jgi:thiol-disulfide isomerase/thioredoxin